MYSVNQTQSFQLKLAAGNLNAVLFQLQRFATLASCYLDIMFLCCILSLADTE